jgi:hypothetical protein
VQVASVHNGRMVDRVADAPLDEYRRRLLAHEELESTLKSRHVWVGYVRLLLVAMFLAAAWFAVFQRDGPRWLVVVPMVLFLVVGVVHGRVLRRLEVARRSAEMYRLGMARIEDRWAGLKERPVGEMSAEIQARVGSSLYAADLDVVGRGGVFELLCVALTRMGEERLLEWLLEPAAVGEILERQAAVVELRGKLDFRERMGVAGEAKVVGVQAEALRTWAEMPDMLTQRWMPWVAGLLAVAAVAAAVYWVEYAAVGALLLVLLMEAAVRKPFTKRIEGVLEGTDRVLKNLRLLAALLKVMEGESFESARLREIAEKLRSHRVAGGAVAGSVAIGRLARLGQCRDSMDNPIVKVGLNLPLMYSVQLGYAVQRWRRRHGGAVRLWLEAVAEMETLLSLATYSYEHPADPFPEFVGGEARVEAVEMGHPLIAAAKCVRNSLKIGGETRVVLISGSNMSGKSTLMRTLGVNAVLAMCGAPVRAESLRLTPLRIGASLLVNDSLQEGHSRFYAEIEKLNRICAQANNSNGVGVMFLLDELLQGTNSKDRMVGAQGVIRALVEAGAIGIVTTHDLALAEMEGLSGGLENMHFQDQIVEGKMQFDFRLREGAAMRSNGVELMRLIGLKV